MTFDEWYSTAPPIKNARDAFYSAYLAGYEQGCADESGGYLNPNIDFSDDGGEDYGDLR